jgi:hypothetical protein
VLAGARRAPPVAFVWLAARSISSPWHLCVAGASLAPAHRLAFLLLALTPMALFRPPRWRPTAPRTAWRLFAAVVLRAADPPVARCASARS